MRQPREVQFPMPWGQMAAQEWGDPSSPRKVVAVHGWMDNSNSFVKLFPLLPGDLHIVSVDCSGHGLSSPRPLGCTYTVLEHAIDIKRLTDALGWETFALIGHSMGGMISFLVASFYPDQVTHVVSIDMLHISIYTETSLAEVSAKDISSMLSFEKKHGKPPVYKNLEEVVDRRMLSTPHSMTRESATIIMKRATEETQGGVVLRTDPRLKFFRIHTYSYEEQLDMLKRYKGRLLVLKALRGSHPALKKLPLEPFIKLFEENCSEFRLVEVDGSHTVHLDEPEKVVDHVKEFFESFTGRMPTSTTTSAKELMARETTEPASSPGVVIMANMKSQDEHGVQTQVR